MIRKIARYRKLYGDVYIYWYFEEGDEENIPRLKVLDSKKITHYVGQDNKVFAYVYRDEITFSKESDLSTVISNPNGTMPTETKTATTLFTKGSVSKYFDNDLIETIPNRKEYADTMQLIHIQYEKEDSGTYSIVPASDLIDPCLLIDKIDTNIDHINTMAGSPQIVAVNADFDSNSSYIGPAGIMYFDSSSIGASTVETVKTEVKTLDISGDLKSQYQQKAEALDIAYEKGKLIPPSVLANVVKSDSAKVITSIKQSLENDIVDFYSEVIVKMSFLIDIMFGTYPNGGTEFMMPDTNVIETKMDQYILKSYKLQNGELTLSENLANMGYTGPEITKRLKEWETETAMMANAKSGQTQEAIDKQTKLEELKITSSSQKEKADQPDVTKEPKAPEPKKEKTTGVDNNAK